MTSKDPITYVLLVVDDSGSMADVAKDVRGGFNQYMAQLRSEDLGEKFRVTVAMFGHNYDLLVDNARLKDVPDLDHKNYRADQWQTKLYDAIGRTVTTFRSNTKMRKKDQAMLVIQTDGRDNASREYAQSQIKAMMQELEADDQWACIFLGAGIDAWGVGGSMGFSRGSTISLNRSSAGVAATYTGLGEATRSYSRGGSAKEAAEAVRDEIERAS